MGPKGLEDTVLTKNSNFISINQKITLPENYKKFSTLKLRIKPAKLIFVGSGSDSNNEQIPGPYLQESENEHNKENVQISEQHEKNQIDYRLNTSYLFSSAESLSVAKERKDKNHMAMNPKMTHRTKKIESEMQYQVEEPEHNEDCEIVKELVLEKFKDLLQKFIEKSNSRRTFSMDQDENLRGWSEYETIHILDPFIYNLQQEVSQQLQISARESRNLSQNVEELREENIGEVSHLTCNTNNEYGGNEGNTTQETEPGMENSENFSRKEYHSSYIHISEPLEAVQTLQQVETKTETIDNHSIVSLPVEDEPNEENCNYYESKFKEEINEQTCAISQVLKILSMCERDKKLSESVLRVEAEKVLLIASLRKELLNTESQKPKSNNEDDENGFVLISGLRIPLDQTYEKKTKQTTFFICVLRCGSTVFCTDLLTPNRHTELEVGEPFCFEELHTEFEIFVEIYTMHLKIREKSSGVKILKKYKKFFSGLKSRFRNTTETNQTSEISSVRKSAFTLIGRTVITKSKLQLREFSLENINPQTSNFNLKELTCNIGSGVKLDNFLSGFLMVCESSSGKTRWRRQWCILDASELKFWDYPGKEQTSEPNRVIDLSRSLLPYIVLADRKFCSRPRSFHLKIGPDSAQEEFYHNDIFLAADNPKDFLFWEKELNRVLKNLINWGCMKTYFENSL